MTFFLVNNKLPSEYAKKISEYGKTIRLPEFELMDFPVNSHPDMLAVNIGGKLFIHSENTLLANTLRSENIHFFSSSAKAGKKYPQDVALNLFAVNKTLFANGKYACADVLNFAQKLGYTLASVKQGYAKCSTMVLGNAIVTADRSIYSAAVAHGTDALLIRPGHVGIEKYDTGFIGGASFELCDGKVAVFGNIHSHPDGEKICDFAQSHGIDIVSLGDGNLFDYGGIVRVNT